MRPDEIPPIPLMGEFVIFDGEAQAEKAMLEDGVPRYEVCKRPQFVKMLESWEVSNDGANLYLNPKAVSFMYYLNSSDPRVEDTNVEPISAFVAHDAAPLDLNATRSLLRNANEGVVFKLTRIIGKGEELLGFYPTSQGSKGVECSGSEVEKGGGSSEGVDDEGGGGRGASQGEDNGGDPDCTP